MKRIYFTVGPSQVYPTLYQHINRGLKKDILSLSHRSSEFKKLFDSTTKNLKELLNIPDNFQVFFVSSALESMERTIQSCCQKTSFHIITGAFGKTWAKYAALIGKNVLEYHVDLEKGINFDDLKIPKKAEIICITQNDTSTGFWIDMEEIIKLKKKYPEKLVAIDVVSSIPVINIDFKYADITFFSVQKGFGLPAGLAVIIAGPDAMAKYEKLTKRGVATGSYHSFGNLADKAKDLQTPETPNVFNIYLLDCVIKDMLQEGIDEIRKSTLQKSQILYNFFQNHPKYTPFIKDSQFRSPTTLVFEVFGESEKIRKKLTKLGYIIGAGYGENKQNHIRIANFPAHKLKNVKSMLRHI